MRQLFLLMIATMLIISCSKEEFTSENYSSSNTQTFKVTIAAIGNEAYPTPFAPGVWVVQKQKSSTLFKAGIMDPGLGLEALAEDGMASMLNDAMESHSKVRSHNVFNTPAGASGPAPIFTGDTYEFYVKGKPNDHLNFATMFIQSNDLFVAPSEEGIPLFDNNKNPMSGDVTDYLYLWDAGTEVNEEPGIGLNQAPRQSGPDTGEVENGKIRLVNDGFNYPVLSDIISVTITPM